MKYLKNFVFLATALLILSCKKPPVADFNYEVLSGGKVVFTNTTSGLVNGYNWAFGDGDSTNEASPTHQYRNSGSYPVILWVKNPDGTSEITKSIEIVIDDVYPVDEHIYFPNASGLLYATNKIEYVVDALGNQTEVKHAEALASFYDNNGFNVSAGIVACSGFELDLNSNNLYGYTAEDSVKFTADTVFYFSGDVNWSVYGGNGIPTVIQTTRQDFPFVSEIIKNDPNTEPEEIDVNKDYQMITLNPIIGADSLIYQIFNENGIVLHQEITDDTQSSYTLSSSLLASFPKGSATLAVRAVVYEDLIFKQKRVYFMNESVVVRDVILK